MIRYNYFDLLVFVIVFVFSSHSNVYDLYVFSLSAELTYQLIKRTNFMLIY